MRISFLENHFGMDPATIAAKLFSGLVLLFSITALQAATEIDVWDSSDPNNFIKIGTIEAIQSPESGKAHYNFWSDSGHPACVNLQTYNANTWMHENTNNGDLSFGFVFSKDAAGSPLNTAKLQFRIVDSATGPFVSQSDDPGEAVQTPNTDAFVGTYRYANNTDGIAVGGISGNVWTVIINSVNFGNIQRWFMAGGGSANPASTNSSASCLTDLADLTLTRGNEYRLTPKGNTPSGAPADATVLAAVAGPDQNVNEGTLVTLDGTDSSPFGEIDFSWIQLAGPAVVLDDPTSATPTFTAPDGPTTLTFQLTVSKDGSENKTDTVDIGVIALNNAPIADAGLDGTVRSGGTATLDGSGSTDPDGDTITYDWSPLPGTDVILSDPTAESPSFTAATGEGAVLEFQLIVSDGSAQSEPAFVSITVTPNNAPVADAGANITRDEGPGVIVSLSGSGSDADGDGFSFAWSQVSGDTVALLGADTASPGFEPGPAGVDREYVFELILTDDYLPDPKSSEPAYVTVTVLNANAPPRCDLAVPSVDSLWPPNHKLSSVSIQGVTDPNDNDVAIIIAGVTQDEPIDGLGDGDTSPDSFINIGQPKDTASLRAERSGTGNGRVYQILFGASDGFESCVGSVSVSVPHSKKSTAIDDGQNY